MFRKSYIKNSPFHRGFHLLVLRFIISILILIVSPNIVRIILGWDGLGITSFFLVIFYKRNKSINAGILTALRNRVGDALILISIAIRINFSSQRLIFINMIFTNNSLILISSLILSSLTKSAQIPFRAWLPAAMAAPTPVSALVHSSTLVTAGVYLLIRINQIIGYFNFIFLIRIIGVTTIIIARLRAIFENDIKKNFWLFALFC